MPTLDWLHREAAFPTPAQVPARVLRPHAAGHRFGDPAGAGNLLIQGDNLEALKALLPFCRGRVKCIFIDPPYNTKKRVRALRRQPGAQPMAEHDAAVPAGGA